MRKDLYNMFKWSLNTSFNKHPNSKISLQELKIILSTVWYDMDIDGEIRDSNNGGPF